MNQNPQPCPLLYSGYRVRGSGTIGVAHLGVLS